MHVKCCGCGNDTEERDGSDIGSFPGVIYNYCNSCGRSSVKVGRAIGNLRNPVSALAAVPLPASDDVFSRDQHEVLDEMVAERQAASAGEFAGVRALGAQQARAKEWIIAALIQNPSVSVVEVPGVATFNLVDGIWKRAK